MSELIREVKFNHPFRQEVVRFPSDAVVGDYGFQLKEGSLELVVMADGSRTRSLGYSTGPHSAPGDFWYAFNLAHQDLNRLRKDVAKTLGV